MSNQGGSLTFKTHEFVRIESGAFLFFPSLRVRSAQANDRSARKGIGSITIEAMDDDSDSPAKGYTIKNTLRVDLNYGAFNELREELRRRHLYEEPVKFEFTLDDGGRLDELRIDGRSMCSSNRRESDFRGAVKRETGS